jgi:hypothetical protein
MIWEENVPYSVVLRPDHGKGLAAAGGGGRWLAAAGGSVQRVVAGGGVQRVAACSGWGYFQPGR